MTYVKLDCGHAVTREEVHERDVPRAFCFTDRQLVPLSPAAVRVLYGNQAVERGKP